MKKVLGALAVAAIGTLSYGCSATTDGGGDRPRLAKDQNIRLAITSDPVSLDPAVGSDSNTIRIASANYIGLARTPHRGKTRWELARDVDVSEDGRTYTFHLRPGLTWSDGHKLTAGDFVYAWRRNLEPKREASYAYAMFDIRGAEQLNAGTGDPDALGVTAVDETTLRVELVRPTPWFLELVALPIFFPLPEHAMQRGDGWMQPGTQVVNGPVKLVRYTPNDRLVFEANDEYWDHRNSHIKQLELRVFEDKLAGIAQYEANKIDGGLLVDATTIDRARKEPGFTLVPQPSISYLAFNTRHPLLRDAKARRALSAAIDRRRLVKELDRGNPPTTAFVASTTTGSDPLTGDEDIDPDARPDVATLSADLREAGVPAGSRLALFHSLDPVTRQMVNVLREDFQAVGVRIEPRVFEDLPAAMAAASAAEPADYALLTSAWVPDYDDPHSNLNLFTCKSGNNVSGYCDKDYDRLVSEAATELSDDRRFALERQAEAMLTGESAAHPVAPLYEGMSGLIIDPSLRGLKRDASGFWYFNDLYRVEQ